MSSEALERREAVRTDRRARYERMVEIRAVEDKIRGLFAEGLVHGTTHTCQGQEAVAVGVASALRPTDVVCCTYRGHGHALALGLTPLQVCGEIMGRVVGSIGGVGGSMHLCDMSVGLMPTFAIVGAGVPVAAGAALTAQVRGTDDVAVSLFGDGAANIGAFHEGINLAAIWKLPAVFICENNQYGEYSPIAATTPIENIAERAGAYGIPGEVVDGQDVDAVCAAVEAAAARARAGEGPSLLEMKTYRYAGHSRSDTAPYRPEGELEEWYERDPIDTFGARLVAEELLAVEEIVEIEASAKALAAEVAEQCMAAPAPGVGSMFENVLV
ncbi:MAG: thiamine pyrophosphate-dependent dehydrogenase E1 component subunit alpha [bacterium]|nr:thiamine pyrophosphate-dependent dehydrogenase E1 component subunit alpha [bacterium]